MKKKLISIFTAVSLVLVMAFALCACSSFGGIKKAFEKAGYEEVEATEAQKESIKELVGEDYDSKVSFHVFQKQDDSGSILGSLGAALDVAIIVEFKKNEDLVEAMNKDLGEENVKEAYNKLQELDTVNENCVIISVSPAALKVFKDAK